MPRSERRSGISGDGTSQRRSSDYYFHIFEESPVPKYVCDLSGAILQANTALCRLLGRRPSEVVGRSMGAFSVEPPVSEVSVLPFLNGKTHSYSCQRRYRSSDGRVLLTRVTLGAVRDGRGRAQTILAEVEDITAEVEAQRESERHRRRWEMALEASDMALFDLDCSSERIAIQLRGGLDTGACEPVVPYSHVRDSMHPDDRHLLPTMEQLARMEGDDLEFEARAQLGNGWRWLRVRGLVLRDGSGRPSTVTGIAADITEHREAAAELAAQRDRLEMALETAGTMAWEIDLQPEPHGLRLIRQDLLGVGLAPAEGWRNDTVLAERVPEEDRELVRSTFKAAITGEQDTVDIEYRWQDGAGQIRWVHTRAKVERDRAGLAVKLTGTTVDVTAARHAVAERLEAERILSRTLEASQDAFFGLDDLGRITDWNPAAEVMFGYFRDEVMGRPLVEGLGSVAGAPLIEMLDSAHLDVDGARLRRELELLSRDGRTLPVEASVVRIDYGGHKLYRAFIRDLSDRRAYEEQLVRHALVDPLTGLPNRALLVDRLNGALGRLPRTGGHVAVLFVDVDRFKIINDSLGHKAGDRLLIALADRLRAALRPADTVARFGADEFVVVCEGLGTLEEASMLSDRVLSVLREPFAVGNQEVFVALSIGIALSSSPDTTADLLIRDADSAMYRAKQRGGSHAEIFDAASRRRSQFHLETESQLRRALERQELRVYYQPVVDLTGKVEKVEALVRWAHPSGRLAPPAEFVPLAEETGLIEAIGEYVLRTACQQVAAWRSEHPQLRSLELAVNVSGVQLRKQSIVAGTSARLDEAGLAPDALILEITESVLMEDTTGASNRLGELREMGVRLAIDDFGTGYSSLLYLRRYPVDLLKIDRSFVAGSVHNPQDAAIVDAVVRLGHSFGLQAVAEGVETEEQLRLLRSLDCDLGQGYLWSRPLPAEEMTRALLASPRALLASPRAVSSRGPAPQLAGQGQDAPGGGSGGRPAPRKSPMRSVQTIRGRDR